MLYCLYFLLFTMLKLYKISLKDYLKQKCVTGKIIIVLKFKFVVTEVFHKLSLFLSHLLHHQQQFDE